MSVPFPTTSSQTIAAWVDGEHHGAEVEISALAPLDRAGPTALAYAEKRVQGDAACVLTTAPVDGRTVIVVDDPKRAFIRVMERIEQPRPSGVHPSAVVEGRLGEGVRVGANAVIEAGATIGDHAVIHAGAVIGQNAVVGAETEIFPKAVLYPGVRVGARCRIHAGAVIGADGFSYHPTTTGPLKVPQLGTVVLGDDVEIGANTCVDRAFLEATTIGDGVKLDNLVQVGHNASIGPMSVVAGQTGISGSTHIGAGVLIGGQVGMADHLTVGDGARIGARSGLIKDIPAGETWLGAPARPIRRTLRVLAALEHLPALVRERK